jgi:hypothetical protein
MDDSFSAAQNECAPCIGDDVPFWVKSRRAVNLKGQFTSDETARLQYCHMVARLVFGHLELSGYLGENDRTRLIENKIQNLPLFVSLFLGRILWGIGITRIALVILRSHTRKFKKDFGLLLKTWPANPKLYS